MIVQISRSLAPESTSESRILSFRLSRLFRSKWYGCGSASLHAVHRQSVLSKVRSTLGQYTTPSNLSSEWYLPLFQTFLWYAVLAMVCLTFLSSLMMIVWENKVIHLPGKRICVLHLVIAGWWRFWAQDTSFLELIDTLLQTHLYWLPYRNSNRYQRCVLYVSLWGNESTQSSLKSLMLFIETLAFALNLHRLTLQPSVCYLIAMSIFVSSNLKTSVSMPDNKSEENGRKDTTLFYSITNKEYSSAML